MNLTKNHIMNYSDLSNLTKSHEYNQSKLPYAVVIGLDSMQGIQTSRILADRKVPVIAVVTDSKNSACRTNTCRQIFTINSDSEALIELLELLGPKFGDKAVLYPATDAFVLLVSKYREQLNRWYRFSLPAPDIVDLLMDKVKFYEFAQKEGFPIPPTFFLNKKEDINQAVDQIKFPAILKPGFRNEQWIKKTTLKAFRIFNKEELINLYEKYCEFADVLIVQEWINGNDSNLYSNNCYFSSASEPLVTFTARKIRQWPPETGQSSLGEECRNEFVEQETIRLFKKVNYRGLGYLEFKRDENSGKYFIVEPNIGRPTGRSAIAEGGGVELLYTMYCDVLGEPLPKNRVQNYRGIKWIHLRRDSQSALYYWRRGQLSLKSWWRSWRGPKVYALLSLKDPLPFFHDLFSAIGILLRKKEREKRIFSS